MQLFHGTTESRSERIAAEGFRPMVLDDEVAAIANRFRTPAGQIIDDLERFGRFSSFRRGDLRSYLTTSFERAASYASRAPEVEWECLWAVYRLQHPQLGYEWNQSDEGHFWVLRQQEVDTPVVMVLDVDDTDLLNRERIVAVQGLEGIIDAAVEVPVDASLRYSVSRIDRSDRRVDRSLLRHILGLTPTETRAQVEAGAWGSPMQYQGEPCWYWGDIKQRLSEDRRLALGLQ